MTNEQTTLFKYKTSHGRTIEVCIDTNAKAPHKLDDGVLIGWYTRYIGSFVSAVDICHQDFDSFNKHVSDYIAKDYTPYTVIRCGMRLCITDNPEYITKNKIVAVLLFPKRWVQQWCEEYGDCYGRATEVFIEDLRFAEFGAYSLSIENEDSPKENSYLNRYYATENTRHDLEKMLENFKLKSGEYEEILGYARKIHHPYFG